ncbi:universal stress protein [Alicyclobacillus contaminans]|nr:universal stress protein [Alicyclobacillus contaminans]
MLKKCNKHKNFRFNNKKGTIKIEIKKGRDVMLQQYQKIMVAVDGSNEAELAFQKAVNIARRNNASLLLVHVIDTRAFQDVNSFDSMLAEQATDLAKQSLSDYSENAKNEGVESVETTIEYGSPKIIIAKQIPEDQNVDLIILGATGLNAVERLFIGSVSEYVTRNALCDVLIVRTDAENKQPEIEEG